MEHEYPDSRRWDEYAVWSEACSGESGFWGRTRFLFCKELWHGAGTDQEPKNRHSLFRYQYAGKDRAGAC